MNPLDLPLWMVLPFLFVLGTVLGSFLNVCIYRLPRHESLWDQLKALSWPPSSCPKCRQSIPRSDNIPVLGWLWLKGRCRFCRGRISPRYPVIEALNGLLFVLVYWMEMPENVRRGIADSCLFTPMGPQIVEVWSTWAWLHWRYAYHIVLLEALLVATFIDLDTMTIPDGATVPAMVLGVLGGGLLGQVFLVPVWFHNASDMYIWRRSAPEWLQPLLNTPDIPEWIASHPHWHGFAVSLTGLIVGGGIVWAVRIIGRWILKREAMGFGDVTLMAAIGSFLGWQPTLLVFFVAPFCAIVVAIAALLMGRGQEIPYGPYLSLGTLIVLLGWKTLWPAAEQVFALGVFAVIFIVLVPLMLALCLQLVQLGKWMLGIPLAPSQEEWIEQWLPSDQLTYLAGENVDDQQGRWRTPRWPGADAGRGMQHERQWRDSGSRTTTSLYRRRDGQRGPSR